MNFQRDISEEFDWYGIDSIGSIALFASGFAAIPKVVFVDEDKYRYANQYFANLPEVCEARLSPWYEIRKNESLNGFANQVKEAKRGLNIFYDEYYTDIYDLNAIPEAEIKVFDLPLEIQEFLRPLTFNTLIFRQTKAIEIIQFFDCER